MMPFRYRHSPVMHRYQQVEHAESCLWEQEPRVGYRIQSFFETAQFRRFSQFSKLEITAKLLFA